MPAYVQSNIIYYFLKQCQQNLIIFLAMGRVQKSTDSGPRTEKYFLHLKENPYTFNPANNSTPFFALVMPSGAPLENCFAELIFQRNLPTLTGTANKESQGWRFCVIRWQQTWLYACLIHSGRFS
jgi:hypothetical protein